MPMFESVSRNAFQITTPEGAFLDPRWTADFLEGLHRHGESFALENAIAADGLRMFVRADPGSGIQRYLQTRFGPAQRPVQQDWLLLRRREDASVRTLYLTDHALLPTAAYSNRQIVQRWRAVMERTGGDGEDPGLRVGVRALLQPAQPNWREEFEKRLRPGKASGGGIASWLWSSDTKDGSADIDPELVAAKASGPAFAIEIQAIAIYKTGPAEKRSAKAALDRVTESVVDLLGGDKIWKRRATQDVSVLKRFGDNPVLLEVEPWNLMESLAPPRSKGFALSPREAAPMWPVFQAMPSPAPPEVLLKPQAAPEPTPVAPNGEASPATASAAGKAPVEADSARDESREARNGLPAKPIRTNSTAAGSYGEEKITRHSAQPPKLPVTRARHGKDLGHGRPHASRGSDRRRAVIAAARASSMRDLRLSGRDLEICDQLGDLPLGTAQDVAYAYGWSPTTCYQSLATSKGAGLVENAKLNAGGALEERSWIPDDQWERIMDDRPLPHTDAMVQWLWLNPQLVAAVYRLLGMAARAAPGRELRALRWLRTRPFEAVAQYSDGWAVFMWSGIWQDREHLEDRLRKCADEFNRHWSGGRGTHWPGRMAFVVPHGWQAERVWRAVAGSVWEGCCAVYDLEGDTLAGDLDLRSSRGRVPPHIHENPSPPRADVARWIDLVVNDTAGRMGRLMFAIEQEPNSTPSYLQHLTRLNGQNVKAGLDQLLKLGLIYQTPDGGYALEPWPLTMAARRDRAWLGLPSRRFGPDRLASRSRQHRKRQRDVQRLLGKFAAAGCSVAPGWQAGDGRFRPDGVVWMDQGPYGPGWHYVLYASRARREDTIAAVLGRAFSETRTDRYPILVICRPEMEDICWSLGAGRPMLTASVSRIRSGPVVGRNGTVWLQYGESVPVLAGPPIKNQEEESHAGTDH